MPGTYTGNAGGVNLNTAATMTEPGGSDGANRASVNTMTERALDYIEAIRQLVAGAVAFAKTLIVNGPSGDDQAALETDAIPTVRKLLWKIKVATVSGDDVFIRLYSVATGYGFEIVLGAAWNVANTWWVPDHVASVFPLKMQWRATSAANLVFQRYDGAGTDFLDSAWSVTGQLEPFTTNGLKTAFLQATAILSAPHFVGSGSSPTFTAGAAADATASTAGSTGTDAAGTVVVTTAGTPGAPGKIATVTFAVPYASAPRSVVIAPTSTEAMNIIGSSHVQNITANGFDIENDSLTPIGTGKILSWCYVVVA